MKYFLLILSLATLLSCHRSSDEDSSSQNQLPEATQTGANTAGCLVNGKIILPRGQKPQSGPILAAQYQYLDGGYHFGLSINDISGALKGINIASDNITFEEGKKYTLSQKMNNNLINAYGSYTFSELNSPYLIYYYTTQLQTGELKITHLDTTKFIISGTFWFDAVNENGEKVEVREGRFDVHYAP